MITWGCRNRHQIPSGFSKLTIPYKDTSGSYTQRFRPLSQQRSHLRLECHGPLSTESGCLRIHQLRHTSVNLRGGLTSCPPSRSAVCSATVASAKQSLLIALTHQDRFWQFVIPLHFRHLLRKRALIAGFHNRRLKWHFLLVRLAGIEPTTLGFGGQYSIH